jgi:uncharacterized protein YceH (UPF0502 family)
LEAIERRLLGVLIEKAKTTPDVYPMSLNALKSGCNQKNNRFPQMQLEEEQLEEYLDSLRQKGAITCVQGSSRVERFRHNAYDWFGVDKAELAVMAELLLRGAQTVGELRGRAARMEPIKGLSELEPVLASLESKKLIVYLTEPGRGAVITHNLYQPREMEKVRREAGSIVAETSSEPPQREAPPVAPVVRTDSRSVESSRDELADLRAELAAMRIEFQTAIESLRDDLESLNRQLGN